MLLFDNSNYELISDVQGDQRLNRATRKINKYGAHIKMCI